MTNITALFYKPPQINATLRSLLAVDVYKVVHSHISFNRYQNNFLILKVFIDGFIVQIIILQCVVTTKSLNVSIHILVKQIGLAEMYIYVDCYGFNANAVMV